MGDEKVQGYEVDMELKGSFGSMKTKSWFDQDCVALRTEMNMGGMNVSMIQVPKKKAQKMEVEAHEILLSSVVPLNATVPKREKNTFIMEAIKGKWTAKLFEGSGQKVERINERSVRVIVDYSKKKKKLFRKGI